jgi:hypothetical protein
MSSGGPRTAFGARELDTNEVGNDSMLVVRSFANSAGAPHRRIVDASQAIYSCERTGLRR